MKPITPEERAADWALLYKSGAHVDLCLDNVHDIVVGVPITRSCHAIAGYLTFAEWIAAGNANARMHLVAELVRAELARRHIEPKEDSPMTSTPDPRTRD